MTVPCYAIPFAFVLALQICFCVPFVYIFIVHSSLPPCNSVFSHILSIYPDLCVYSHSGDFPFRDLTVTHVVAKPHVNISSVSILDLWSVSESSVHVGDPLLEDFEGRIFDLQAPFVCGFGEVQSTESSVNSGQKGCSIQVPDNENHVQTYSVAALVNLYKTLVFLPERSEAALCDRYKYHRRQKKRSLTMHDGSNCVREMIGSWHRRSTVRLRASGRRSAADVIPLSVLKLARVGMV